MGLEGAVADELTLREAAAAVTFEANRPAFMDAFPPRFGQMMTAVHSLVLSATVGPRVLEASAEGGVARPLPGRARPSTKCSCCTTFAGSSRSGAYDNDGQKKLAWSSY